MVYKIGLFLIIIFLGIFLRFYNLEDVPKGLNVDEASMGYNAFSLLETGKDRYGQSWPLVFRSFGSFQMPLYTYFTMIPVWFFGNQIFSVHFVSAVSGVILIVISFLIFRKIDYSLGLMSAFLVAISPWSVLFHRMATEATLGLSLFSLGVYFAVTALNKRWFLILSFFFFGVATHAYYSERILAVLFIIIYTYIFRSILIKNFRNVGWLVFAFLIFFTTQIPHLVILNTSAFSKRAEQVSYWDDRSFMNYGGNLKNVFGGKAIYVFYKFGSHYTSYFSPRNLFSNSDPQLVRSIPDLSVFYSIMIIPMILGIRVLISKISEPIYKILVMLLVISPIPASLTGDPFYTLRVLEMLWGLTIVISMGMVTILKSKLGYFKYPIIIGFFVVFLFSLWSSYFGRFKYERAEHFGASSIALMDELNKYQNSEILINPSDLGVGLRLAYLLKYDPGEIQKELKPAIKQGYYSQEVIDENLRMGNIQVRPIFWEDDIYKRQLIVGDLLAISFSQATEHKLRKQFEIKGMDGEIRWVGYLTDPESKCQEKLIYTNKQICIKDN